MSAQSLKSDDKLVAAINRLVEKQRIDGKGPGVAILIHQPGKLLFKSGYGLANLKTEKSITRHTMFELASVSKTFTVTAVLILHDQGKLSIDDDIRKHLSELPQYSASNPIRIRQPLGPLAVPPTPAAGSVTQIRGEDRTSDEQTTKSRKTRRRLPGERRFRFRDPSMRLARSRPGRPDHRPTRS